MLGTLNAEQQRAVECGLGPSLILAGAGSGKTRVLTHRIAYLIEHHKVHPTEILAVTFTNKAAAEMRKRVMDLLVGSPISTRELWISTFHSACVRILRSDIHHLGYQSSFTIYDDSDQLSIIKACMKEMNISDSRTSPKSFQARINQVKNDGYDFLTYKPTYDGYYEDVFVRLFERYTEVLKLSSALDFADLILLTVKLFQEHPKVLKAYQDRFPFLLIDEYQDTNRCQYLLMKLLAGERANICAVGDEDQSIYKWRGADITNILNFEKDFPQAKIFKLEENYRSSKNIIEAASQVISNNLERRDKQLWTRNDEGEKIAIFECYDEHDEAQKIIDGIVNLITQGMTLDQMAIFYRTNAQSRLLEDQLRSKGISYQIYGGLKFYERLEIKDMLAYLKLIANPLDDVSFRRVVNVPARGIGATSVERLGEMARKEGLSHYQLIKQAFTKGISGVDFGRANKSLRAFFEMMERFRALAPSLLPSDLLQMVLEQTGYRKSLVDENSVESQSRLENLAELRQSIVEYELRSGADNPTQSVSLEGFLQEIALVSSMDKEEAQGPSIRMMTIHMAKGLEFDVVMIAGLEEELFPNIRPWEGEDTSDVEEERRLFYVGMTRARQKLALYYAKNRTVFGNSSFRVMSRFIEEIPSQYYEMKRADYFSRRRHYSERDSLPESEPTYDDTYSQLPEDENAFRQGEKVIHPIFGEGIICQMLDVDKLVVNFPGKGRKKISLRFTELRKSEC